jgi:hypothetical protein
MGFIHADGSLRGIAVDADCDAYRARGQRRDADHGDRSWRAR